MKNVNNNIINTSSTRFNQRYILDDAFLKVFQKAINASFKDNISYLFNNPSESYISLMVFPFNVMRLFRKNSKWYNPQHHPDSQIYMGNVPIGAGGVGARGWLFPNDQTYVFKVASFRLGAYLNLFDYKSYNPYTKVELYLPYCAFITLDVATCGRGEIGIYYSIDWTNGNCTAYLVRETDKTCIQTANGQIGFELPLGATNKNENAKQMLQATATLGASAVGTALTGNPLALFGGVGNFLNRSFNAMQEHVNKLGTPNGINAIVSPSSFYLIITSQQPTLTSESEENDYRRLKGMPLESTLKFSTLQGFTQIESVNLKIPNIMSTELNELERLLKDGVIF